MFRIDPKDPAPIYAQLERAVRTAVAAGRIMPGDRLPTVRQLAVELQINANTVARVYATLEREGVLETHRGVGTFASRPTRDDDRPARHQAVLDDALRARSAQFINDTAELGFAATDVIAYLQRTFGSHPPRTEKV